ncbi:FomB family phosphonate monophosphate kinase [Actinoplanes sp. NPDC026623]|uniref:FomB family phosphonate monophosphate kinase n=1 Tax=Actinoplanes sp. NPDC026623 TaxID=3155610 RepID=UPI0034033E9D
MADVKEPLYDFPVRDDRVVDLHVVTVRVRTNVPNAPAFRYFSRYASSVRGEALVSADYELNCIDLDHDAVDLSAVSGRVDATLRAKLFRTGYYLVHRFGDPAHLITVGRSFYVFGTHLERIVWPYFIKHILTINAADHGFLHLKAAAFADGDNCTLLVGANGGGKTVFLAQACAEGSSFVSNTHTMIRDGLAYAVPTAIRIRNDGVFGPLIASRGLSQHMEDGDYLVTAEALFGRPTRDLSRVRNLIIADYQPGKPRGLEGVNKEDAAAFVRQFGLALTVYGLRDDLFEHHQRDFHRYTATLHETERQLRDLTGSVRCFRANVDMTDKRERSAVMNALST